MCRWRLLMFHSGGGPHPPHYSTTPTNGILFQRLKQKIVALIYSRINLIQGKIEKLHWLGFLAAISKQNISITFNIKSVY